MNNNSQSPLRIGHGYDVHALADGDHIILGGVRIPFNKSIIAHSDGDVLLHAICDALLGAAALGDIGKTFPDSDAQYKDINSRELLTQVRALLADKAYAIVNLDATIVAQQPTLAPYTAEMASNIASDLQCPQDRINIKATTTEGLGAIGRIEGIAAHSVVLIEKQEKQDSQ